MSPLIPTQDTSPAQSRPLRRAGLMLVGVCGLIALVDGYDTQTIAFAAPGIATEFGLSQSMIGTMFSAGLLGGMCGILPTVYAEARLGRRLLLSLCLIWFSAGSAGTALAPTSQALVAMRFISGLGLGMAFPLLIGTMADSVPDRIRARAMSVVTCGIPAGGICAGAVSTAMLPGYGWRVLFWIGMVLPLVLFPFVWQSTELIQFGAHLDGDNATAGPKETTVSHCTKMLRDGGRALSYLLLTAFCVSSLSFSLTNWIPSLFVAQRFSTGVASAAGGFLNAGALAAVIVLSCLLDRGGAARVTGTCYALAAILLLLLGHARLSAQSTLALITAVGFFAIGPQLGVTYMIASSIRPAYRVAAVSAATISARLGAAIGPLAVGFLVETGSGAAGVLSLMAVATLAICVTIFVSHRS